MTLEIVGALGVAARVLWLVFGPPTQAEPVLEVPEPEAAEESRRGQALLALREIEFDRETGKLSDRDYELLKARYSVEALSALAAEEPSPAGGPPAGSPSAQPPVRPSVCPACGPRPEPEAVYCSNCGRRV